MTSRQLVIKLIDENKINGEEAVLLLNDIIISELCEAQKVLDQCKSKSPILESNWLKAISPSTYTYSGGTGVADATYATALTANSI